MAPCLSKHPVQDLAVSSRAGARSCARSSQQALHGEPHFFRVMARRRRLSLRRFFMYSHSMLHHIVCRSMDIRRRRVCHCVAWTCLGSRMRSPITVQPYLYSSCDVRPQCLRCVALGSEMRTRENPRNDSAHEIKHERARGCHIGSWTDIEFLLMVETSRAAGFQALGTAT